MCLITWFSPLCQIISITNLVGRADLQTLLPCADELLLELQHNTLPFISVFAALKNSREVW